MMYIEPKALMGKAVISVNEDTHTINSLGAMHV